jgi:hypothetical protein
VKTLVAIIAVLVLSLVTLAVWAAPPRRPVPVAGPVDRTVHVRKYALLDQNGNIAGYEISNPGGASVWIFEDAQSHATAAVLVAK